MTIPSWMVKHVQDARELFGLGGAEWHFIVRSSDKPLGDSGNDGAVNVDAVYLNANIEMHEGLADTPEARSDIYHEVLHAAHDEIDRIAERVIRRLPKRERRIYDRFYREAVERFVQRTSRSITARIKPEGER